MPHDYNLHHPHCIFFCVVQKIRVIRVLQKHCVFPYLSTSYPSPIYLCNVSLQSHLLVGHYLNDQLQLDDREGEICKILKILRKKTKQNTIFP